MVVHTVVYRLAQILKAFSMVMLTVLYGDRIHVTKEVGWKMLFEGIVSSHHAVPSRSFYDYELNTSPYI